MPAPDTALVKTWCRIDGAEFDSILPTMIAEAASRASHETGVDYSTVAMPSGVQMWCAAQVAHWLANPAATIEQHASQVNPFLSGLLDPHRTFGMESAAE